MSERLEGPGWWQASDGHWYPPHTHPTYRPFGMRARRRHAAAKPPYHRRAWLFVVAAVIVTFVVITAVGGPAKKKPSAVTLATGPTPIFTISGSGKSAISPVPAPGADFVSRATTAGPASAPTATLAPMAGPATPHPQTASRRSAPIPGCHATMGDATPVDGETDNVTVTSDVPNTAATVTAHYKTADYVFALQTDAAGGALLRFSIGRPTPHFTVDVSVVVGGGMCWTSFEPR